VVGVSGRRESGCPGKLSGKKFLGLGSDVSIAHALVPHLRVNVFWGESRKAVKIGSDTKKTLRPLVAFASCSITQLLLRKWRGEVVEKGPAGFTSSDAMVA
jgi:hypothetical protein